jgi:hypothetical protein
MQNTSSATLNTLHRIIPALAGTIIILLRSAFAATPIIPIDPSKNFDFDENHGDGMVGWSFELLAPFTVSQVGWYDQDGDGLSRPFQVGLWQGKVDVIDPTTPYFPPGQQYPSLIGDADNGLIIPAGTNAALVGTWRVVDLAEPLILQPGVYALGGLDTSSTTDVIKYRFGGPVPPVASPLMIGAFFYAAPNYPVEFGPSFVFYAAWGLELGPMLLGTNAPVTQPGLNFVRFPLGVQFLDLPSPASTGILLSWAAGTLHQADRVDGPYTTVTNSSPYVYIAASPLKFFRLGP